jgi:hypothetical protein
MSVEWGAYLKMLSQIAKNLIKNPRAEQRGIFSPGEVALRGTYPFFAPRGGVCTPSARISGIEITEKK